MKNSIARTPWTLAAVVALGLAPVLAGCSDDPSDPVADAGTVIKTDAGNTPTDAGTDQQDAGETLDAGNETPDAGGPVGPAAGELGGACGEADACTEGECEALPDDRGSFCTKGCYDNSECPENLRCEAVTTESMFCLFGERGTGVLGDPCGEGKGLGCASGLCLDADPEEEIPVDTCTKSCESDTDCMVPFPSCAAFYYVCLPIPSGELGGICRYDGSCFDELACTDVPGIGERCTRTCTAGEDCGQPYLECADANGTSYCLMKSAE